MSAYQSIINNRNTLSQQTSQQPVTLGNIGNVLSNTIHNLPENLGNAISGLGQDVLNVPIAPGLSLIEFHNALTSTDTDQLTNALEKITGVNITETFNQFGAIRNIDARLNEYAEGIKRQVMVEIRECIEKHLRSIIAINPILRIIFDPAGALAREIAKIRLEIQRKIQKAIESILFRRIKIQQVAIFRQRILQGIRSICPATGIEKRQSRRRPTLERNFSIDTTWRDSTSLPYSNSPNNLFVQMSSVTDSTVNSIIGDVRSQIQSTANKDVNNYFNENGVPA